MWPGDFFGIDAFGVDYWGDGDVVGVAFVCFVNPAAAVFIHG